MPAQGHDAAAAQPSAKPSATPISQAEVDLEAPASSAGEKSIRLDLDDVNGEVLPPPLPLPLTLTLTRTRTRTLTRTLARTSTARYDNRRHLRLQPLPE